MNIYSPYVALKLEEITQVNVAELKADELTKSTLVLIQQWRAGKESFIFYTSGSTGKPKKVATSREKIVTSANATFQALRNSHLFTTTFLCLNPSFIGGAMVVFRALIKNLDLYVGSLSSSPLKDPYFNGKKFDLVSMVPLQITHLKSEDFRRFHTILVGGAVLEKQKFNGDSTIYSTYGMTETVSHIALRKIDEEFYHLTGDWKIAVNNNGNLKVKGSISDHKWIQTHDQVLLKSERSFKWLGRSDFVINSGGIKIQPEIVEQRLRPFIQGIFLISWIKNEKLGQQVVLISEQFIEESALASLTGFQRPKQIFNNQKIFFTESGKVDRIKTQKRLQKSIDEKTVRGSA
ncbi:MAG: AMP-binding protein [Bacteroidota bacterium]